MMVCLILGGCRSVARDSVRQATTSPEGSVEVIAHRGASADFPENTMAAFRGALEARADWIELDVMGSADGQAVVFHDETLDRTTDGEGPLAERTWAELAELDAGAWKAPDFVGERIPSLDELLEWSVGRIPLNVELKVEGGGEPALVLTRTTVDLVRDHGALETTIFSSFDPVAVAEAARLCPECQVALLWDGRGGADPLEQVEATRARALHLAQRGLSADLVEGARARGLPLRVYTINTEADLRAVLDMGVDGVFTDRPAEMRGWLVGAP
jgi:glycerophosphoryl diester phosphodiesterase